MSGIIHQCLLVCRVSMAIYFNKRLDSLSTGARYFLMHLCNLIGVVEKIVEGKNIYELSKISGLSERSVNKYIKELKEKEIIDVSRNVIFGKGPGKNIYYLYEKIQTSLIKSNFTDKVLSSYTIKPFHKFILVTMLSYSDDFGVVEGLGLTDLSKLTGLSQKALKDNLTEMFDLDLLFGYSPGGNSQIVRGKVKGVFYLNLVRYKCSDLKIIKNEKSLTCNNIIKYFYENTLVKTKLNIYIQSLSQANKRILFNLITCKVDKYTGILLTQIVKPGDEFAKKYVQSFIEHLQSDVFNVDTPRARIIDVNLPLFRKTLKKFTFFNNTIKDIHNSFLQEWLVSPPDNSDESFKFYNIAKELSDEVVYLVHLYAFWIYFEMFIKAKKFSVIRKGSISKSGEELQSAPCLLIGKVR